LTKDDSPILVRATGIGVRFGALQALDGIDLTIRAGECIGLVGHNGAGKSTLINVINGNLSFYDGQLSYGGKDEERGVRAARKYGICCVFQELSLFPNLSVAENVRIITRLKLGGLNWRKHALALIKEKLDDIFPNNTIDCRATIAELGLAQQQMVEIAINFLDIEPKPRLVILDEPTSSLDASIAEQLLQFVRSFVMQGGSVILISHMLGEILSASTRILVMKDGKIVADRPAQNCSRHDLVTAMGDKETRRDDGRQQKQQDPASLVLSAPPRSQKKHHKSPLSFKAYQGEIIGFAGLAGHGQSDMLLALYGEHRTNWLAQRSSLVEFIAGDRRLNGIFPLWSIGQNLSIASLYALSKFWLINRHKERNLAQKWQQDIGIKTLNMGDGILSLSGGNQQKVLFARALATPAPIILMDDPMRGVDVGTKNQVYDMVRREAAEGRTFIWYSTEMDEIELCDRVYVFREGAIVAEFVGQDITEKNIIAASFAEGG